VKNRIYIWLSLLVAILLGWGGYRAYLAHQNLVTLDVRDMDVRDVLRKCEWQTWETIVVHKDVKGKVTLNVRKMPLEEVLGIIGDQTSTRATAVYPIYSKNNSVVNLRKLARGDIYRDTAGWTNFSMVGAGGGGGGGRGRGGPGGGGPGGFGGFGDGPRTQNSRVSLTLSAKDLSFAALALARFSSAQVVPEDGANALITLKLEQVPFSDAVAKVAKESHRKWDVFYSVQAMPEFFGRGGGPGEDGSPDGGRRGFGRFGGDGETNQFSTNRWAELREQRDAQRQIETEARLATMTAEEQAKEKERQEMFEKMRNMTPEERQQAFQAMESSPEFAANRQRMENRANNNFKYSTPAQRVDRVRRIADMKQRRQQQGR